MHITKEKKKKSPVDKKIQVEVQNFSIFDQINFNFQFLISKQIKIVKFGIKISGFENLQIENFFRPQKVKIFFFNF